MYLYIYHMYLYIYMLPPLPRPTFSDEHPHKDNIHTAKGIFPNSRKK